MVAQSECKQRLLERYAKLREENETSVAKNDIVLDTMWGDPCLAYNVQVLLPPSIHAPLVKLQTEIEHQETGSLLRCPAHALHISIASLIPVRTPDSSQDKEAQWQSIRYESQTALRKVAKTTRDFQIRFCRVIATDGAIITVATDDGHMQTIREKLREYVPLRSTPINIIHCTLFRYHTRLENPQKLLADLQTRTLRQIFTVDELQIRRETMYPSLASDLAFASKLAGSRI